MTAAAIKATWATYKPVPTRNVLQLTLEVPLEQQADVFKRLGYPVPGTETWVGVALLNPVPATNSPIPSSPVGSGGSGKRRFDEMPRSQQAALLCADERFQDWMEAADEDQCATLVRLRCRVHSRAILDTDDKAAGLWLDLKQQYREQTGQTAEQRG